MYNFSLGHYTTPGRMYHAPNKNYYFEGDDWYGLGYTGSLGPDGTFPPWAGFGQEDPLNFDPFAPAVAPEVEQAATIAAKEKDQRRRMAMYAVRGGVGLASAAVLTYVHHKNNIDWYCSILASLVWGGLIGESAARITGYAMEAKGA